MVSFVLQAMKNNAGMRVWIIFGICVLAFTLLFLDWYYDQINGAVTICRFCWCYLICLSILFMYMYMVINFISSFPHLRNLRFAYLLCIIHFQSEWSIGGKMITISISLLKDYQNTKCITTGRKINGLLFAHYGINNC